MTKLDGDNIQAKNAEAMLEHFADSNQLIKAIMASTKHLIIATDSEGLVTFFNKASEEALGYDAVSVIGKETPALWHDKDEVVLRAKELSQELNSDIKPGFDVFIMNPQKFEKESREWTFWRKDGSKFPVNLTVTCIRNNKDNIIGYLGVIEDITDRKRAEEEILEAKTFLKLINDNNPDLVFVKDKEFRIIEANLAFKLLYPKEMRDRIIGYTTIEDYNAEEAEVFLEKDREAFEKGYSQVLERIVFPNGSLRILDTQKIRFENNQGEEFILCLGRDVTERESLVDDLTHSNEKLEHFAYICSHDLQEPLRMVRSFSELLGRHIGHLLDGDEKGKRYLQFVLDGATRAQDLISDILAYSKIDKDMHRPELVDIETLIEAIIENIEIDLVRFEGNITYDPQPQIIGNKTQFYQLFQNLINNAIKYQKQGSKVNIHISVEEEKEHWKFSIKDNGIGIDKRFFKKIFDVFQRLHNREEYSGTGIGLAICRKVVERHGGQIWVESELGKGSIFYFTLSKSNNSGKEDV